MNKREEQNIRMKTMLTKSKSISRTPYIPTNEQAIKSMIGNVEALTDEEKEENLLDDASTLPEHYDDQILQAAYDLENNRALPDPFNPTKIEQPRDRIHRIGQESISKGKPSQLYLEILKEIAHGFEIREISARFMAAAQRRLNIALAYKTLLSKNVKTPPKLYVKGVRVAVLNLMEIKREFKRERKNSPFNESSDLVDDALRSYNLDRSAYSVDARRKLQRKK